MKIIKGIFEFSNWREGDLSIREVKKKSIENQIEFRWELDGRDCGMAIFMEDGDYATIVAYRRNNESWVPKGIGYEFIKMCIDDILNHKKGIISLDNIRNEKSDEIIKKLSSEYSVIDGMYKGSRAKLIIKK
jgi:hypothetical protein